MSHLDGVRDWLLRKVAVRANVRTGRDFHVGPGSAIWAPRSLRIGNDVYVGKHVTIEVDGTIGDSVLIANSVGIVGRRDHDMKQEGTGIRTSKWVGDSPEDLSDPVHIGSDVWIGFGAIVLSGVHIGDHCVVGAGAIVTSSIPSNCIAYGQPARVMGQRFSEAELDRHRAGLIAKGVTLSPIGELS